MGDDIPEPIVKKGFSTREVNRRGNLNAVLFLPGLKHLGCPVDLTFEFTQCHLLNPFPPLITVTASKVALFSKMPLDKKIKALYCRTGNYVFFQLFHFKHRLPGSAARIIAQNFASCRLACSFMVTFFFISFTSFSIYWPGSKWAAASLKI
jgi:hypothetical protein